MPFIPLFTQIQIKECDQPTSESIPDSSLVFNSRAQQILQRPTPLSILTAHLRTNLAQRFIRSALFQQDHLCVQHPETIVMWDKIETGYTSSNEVISWVYIQTTNKYSSHCLSMINSLSCTIIYQQQNVEIDRIFLLKAVQNFKQITGRSPIVFYLRSQDAKEQNQLKQVFSFHEIYLPKENQLSGTSNIKSIFQIGRKIIDESFVLRNKKNFPFSASVIPFFFKLWNQQSSFQEIQKPQKIWKCAVQQFQSVIKEKCILEYRNRMLKLYEDKKFISMKLVKNSHQISMQIALKSVQKYKSTDEGMQQKLEGMIKEELNKILEQIMQINYKWGQNFIETEYSQIENRLKSKEFKSISSIKNQFNLFRDYFYKKSESLSCKKLQNYFSQFVLDKAFESSSYIFDSEKKSLNVEISQLKEKLALVQNELKQSKRQLTKQLSLSLKNIEGLEQKINSLKNKEELLEGTIEQIKQDRDLREKENEEKIQQIQERFSCQIDKLKEQNSVLMDEVAEGKRNKSILESDIQKEKQMHRQTNQHYKQVISQLKNKEGYLLNEIAEVTRRATQQLQQYRKDTQRSLSKSSMSQNQKEKEGLKMVEEINSINQRYSQLQKAFNHLEYEMQLKKAEESVLKNDLEIALKIAEQKVYDYEIKMPRFLKMEEQIGIYEQMMEEQSNRQKEIEKQTALLRQQNTFIMEHIQEIQVKYEDEKLQNKDLKINLEELQQKLGKMNRVMVNQWVQTQNDSKFREMLTDALNMVTVLESQYNKVKVENHKLRYRSSNY